MGRSEQRERGPFRALKMRPVRQEAVHSLWSRLFCGPLKMRRVPEKAVFGTEYLFRTVEACFLHRMLPKMRRVPQEAFLSTARIFRTIGGPLRYRMPEAGCRRSGAWRSKKEADLFFYVHYTALHTRSGENIRVMW